MALDSHMMLTIDRRQDEFFHCAHCLSMASVRACLIRCWDPELALLQSLLNDSKVMQQYFMYELVFLLLSERHLWHETKLAQTDGHE